MFWREPFQFTTPNAPHASAFKKQSTSCAVSQSVVAQQVSPDEVNDMGGRYMLTEDARTGEELLADSGKDYLFDETWSGISDNPSVANPRPVCALLCMKTRGCHLPRQESGRMISDNFTPVLCACTCAANSSHQVCAAQEGPAASGHGKPAAPELAPEAA